MKRILVGILCGIFWGGVSFASTDYACLKTCVNDGETRTACMLKCTYEDGSLPLSGIQPHTDSFCLQSCVKEGRVVAACVPKCTVVVKLPSAIHIPANSRNTSTQIHNILKPPVPYKELVLHKPSPIKQKLSVDYRCLNLCVRGGLQYQLCDQHCTVLQDKPLNRRVMTY